MSKLIQITIVTSFVFIFSYPLQAQYGYGNRYGARRGSAIPEAQTPQKEPTPKTADDYVDEQMPRIVESLELDPFEEAVVRSTLVKYVQKRLELQILKLEPQKMKEQLEKIQELQDAELKAGLPEDKYIAYKDLGNNQNKKKRKKKKKKTKS